MTGIFYTAHDCREHLEYSCYESVETHGLDCGPYERRFDEVWTCSVCRERFTAQDLDRH